MSDPVFKYCPLCTAPLIEHEMERVRRPVCPQCGFIQYLNPKVVVLVVIRCGDKLLLSKRNIEPGKGLWNFCGGFVELGETVQEAALREVKEEANLEIQLENLIGIYSGEGDTRVVIAYQASMLDHQMRSLRIQRKEVSETGPLSLGRATNVRLPRSPTHLARLEKASWPLIISER